ncbi:MAG: hypothetical protein U0556_13240 [Dehalococcoidia bacterium]
MKNRLMRVVGIGFLAAGLTIVPLTVFGEEPIDPSVTWQPCAPGTVVTDDMFQAWGINPQDLADLGLQNESGQFVCPQAGVFPMPPGPGADPSEWARIRRAIGAWAGTIVGPLFPDAPPPAAESGPDDPAAPPPAPPSGYAAPGR